MLRDGLFQPVGLFFGEGQADGFRLYLGGPGEARAGLADGPAIDGALAEVTDAGEFSAQGGVASFQWRETREGHDAFFYRNSSRRQA